MRLRDTRWNRTVLQFLHYLLHETWQERWPSWISICLPTKYADMVLYIICGIICSYVINGIICSKYVKYLYHWPRTKTNLHFSCLIIPGVYIRVWLLFMPTLIFLSLCTHYTLPGNVFCTEETMAQCLMLTNQETHCACKRRWRMDNRKNWCPWRATLCQTLLWCGT